MTAAVLLAIALALAVKLAVQFAEIRMLRSDLVRERMLSAHWRRAAQAAEWRDTWDDVTEDLGAEQ